MVSPFPQCVLSIPLFPNTSKCLLNSYYYLNPFPTFVHYLQCCYINTHCTSSTLVCTHVCVQPTPLVGSRSIDPKHGCAGSILRKNVHTGTSLPACAEFWGFLSRLTGCCCCVLTRRRLLRGRDIRGGNTETVFPLILSPLLLRQFIQ